MPSPLCGAPGARRGGPGNCRRLRCPRAVVGLGGVGLDYLAQVAGFPEPDAKLRTEALEAQGGGNCGNALTAASRLGCAARVVSKVGGDGLAQGICRELEGDGVDCSFMEFGPEGEPSPFTYIIVDRAGGTRTCIHTPGVPPDPAALGAERIDRILEGATLVYFDGRLTEVALKLAAAAEARGVPVLVETERLRPNLDRLAMHADVVVTSAHFPTDWTGYAELGDALVEMSGRLPRAKRIITTLGTRGSVLLDLEADGSGGEGEGTALNDAIAALEAQCRAGETGRPFRAASGAEVVPPAVASSAAAQVLTQSAAACSEGARELARVAASTAASMNADSGGSQGYLYGRAPAAERPGRVVGRVYFAGAAGLAPERVEDTTGAGDAFIGSILYALTHGLGPEQSLRLAACVAAVKCTALGARPGLPTAAALPEALLRAA